MYWSQKDGSGDTFLIRSTENSVDPGNPFFATGANAFCTTNFRSRFAMRDAETHGNMRRDSTTLILRIALHIYKTIFEPNISKSKSNITRSEPTIMGFSFI